MIAPLGDVEEPEFPFEVTSMDITSPYPTTQRGNKYLLTFIDHLTKYAEAFPKPDHTAETCARVYSSQIVMRHGSGSTLITDQGREFMLSFFPKNVQNIRSSQGAYFQLPCVLKWGGGKTPPFPPFRPLALRKCESQKLGRSRTLLPHVPQSNPSHHHGVQPILLVAWEGNGSAQYRKFKGSPP